MPGLPADTDTGTFFFSKLKRATLWLLRLWAISPKFYKLIFALATDWLLNFVNDSVTLNGNLRPTAKLSLPNQRSIAIKPFVVTVLQICQSIQLALSNPMVQTSAFKSNGPNCLAIWFCEGHWDSEKALN